MLNRKSLLNYAYLMRLHQPIGILLLLWPTLWGLWLANRSVPAAHLLLIFIAGVLIMRAAGCVINDILDKDFDGFVKRTELRPLASERLSTKEAWFLFILLMGLALLLALFLNRFAFLLALIGAWLASIYPLMKRFTHLPQVFLGLAFAWGIPMAFAATTNTLPPGAWVLYLAGLIWPIIYDTLYAMVDRDDDIKIGVKSTAILFGAADRFIVALLQCVFLLVMTAVGIIFRLNICFYLSLLLCAVFFCYQQLLISSRNREKYFQAFLNNQWIGLFTLIGIVLGVK